VVLNLRLYVFPGVLIADAGLLAVERAAGRR